MEFVVYVWLFQIYLSGLTSGTVFATVGNNATFSAVLNPLPDNITIVSVTNPRNKTVFDARGTQCRYATAGQRMVYTGNTFEGKMSFVLKNILTEDAGTYTYQNTSIIFGSTTLFVLGIPSKPNIEVILKPIVNMNLVLNCKVQSTTVPQNHNLSMIFNWNVNGVNVSTNLRYFINGSTLSIKNMKSNDEGMNITCTASEQRGLTSKTSDVFTVYPLYGPGTVTFLPPNAIYVLQEQETIPDITCSADCKPNCGYKWTKDGQVTSQVSGSILSLRNINCNDTGLYRCTAWNEYGTKNSSDINVDIKYGPETVTFTPSTTSYSLSEQGTIPDITCSANCKPNCSYRWTKDGQVTSRGSSSTLSMNNINHNDTGVYRCTAWNSHGTKSSNDINVDVQYGPGTVTFTPTTTSYSLIEQGTIPDITCTTDCKPNCNYRWTKDGQVTSRGIGRILSLRNISRNDTGTYRCTAWNYHDTKNSNEMNIDVKYIDINPVASKMTFETTQDIQLTCSVKGNYEGVVFRSWTQTIGSSVVRTLDGFTTNNETVLNIPYSGYQDVGNYTCYVYGRNGMFMNSKDMEVTVNDKPVITDTIKIQEHKGTVEILVDFYSVPKPLKVEWMKEGTVVSLSEKYRQSNIVVQITLTVHEVRVQLKGYRAKLTITNVTDDDFGTYMLRIENVKGIATQQVNYQRKNQQIEEKGETNAFDSTIIGIVIGVSVTVAVTVTVVIVIYFSRRRRINKKENVTVKMNEKIESKYEELQVRAAQEPYDAPGTEVLKNIYINDVGDKDRYGHSQTEEDKAEYEEIQGRENSTLEPKSEYEITEIN